MLHVLLYHVFLPSDWPAIRLYTDRLFGIRHILLAYKELPCSLLHNIFADEDSFNSAMDTKIQAAPTTTWLDNVLQLPTLEVSPTHSDWHYFRHTLENYIKLLNMADDMQLPLLQNCIGRDGNNTILDSAIPAKFLPKTWHSLCTYSHKKQCVLLEHCPA